MSARIAVAGSAWPSVSDSEVPRLPTPPANQQATAADDGWAWTMLTAASARARDLDPRSQAVFGVGPAGDLVDASAAGVRGELHWHDGRWSFDAAETPALIDLYLTCCAVSRASPLTIGHLGQSLDGNVATASGDSDFVTGRANIVHLHRMRALCDAIVVGAGTVAADDPRLTTRHVPGENPMRVVLDPNRRLEPTHKVFADDAAPTLLVTAETSGDDRHGNAEVLAVGYAETGLDLEALIEVLRARGLLSLFVEGGGVTVSRFLEAGLLDRLQIAVAPMLTGRGRAGVQLPGREHIADCLRPSNRVFAMGEDFLFDCDLKRARAEADADMTLRRIS